MNTKSLNYFIYAFAVIGLVSIITAFNTQSENDIIVGQFQVATSTYMQEPGNEFADENFIYETIINTSTGKITSRKKIEFTTNRRSGTTTLWIDSLEESEYSK